MKNTLATIALVLLMSCSAFAQSDTTTISQATDVIAKIRSRMLDPDSFVLDAVHTAEGTMRQKKDRIRVTVLCFAYRSRNHMNGYSEGRAYLKGGDLQLFSVTPDVAETLGVPGYDAESGWFRGPCQTKHFTGDITAEVKTALAPSAPTTVSPADAAKQAQQYADCLKAAVDNPSIVCKQ